MPRTIPPARSTTPFAWRGKYVLGGMGLLAMAVAFGTTAMSLPREGPKLTHVIVRGDLRVTVRAEGLLESSENNEIKCKVRGFNTVIWIIENGAIVEPGDELLRLDTLLIEEQINERTKYANWSRAGAEYFKAKAASAELAVSEYEQGTFVAQLMEAEKALIVAESTVGAAKSILEYTKLMAENGYQSELDVEQRKFELAQADADVNLKRTQLEVLNQFTKAEQLKTLKGAATAMKAQYAANAERATADASRRDRAMEEFDYCVVKAERAGLVIHPSAAQWENAPEITEGSTVHKDQVLLLMPDLSKMQVKLGIHEAIVDRIKVGLSAGVTLPTRNLDGNVSEVASVAKPAGWWTGNEVKYDALVALPPVPGLRPGMSAEVEILVAQYDDVLKIPVAAVVEGDEASYCWVKTRQGIQRRSLKLGDSNGVFTVVQSGLAEGESVVLHPLGLAEARLVAGKPSSRSHKKPDTGML